MESLGRIWDMGQLQELGDVVFKGLRELVGQDIDYVHIWIFKPENSRNLEVFFMGNTFHGFSGESSEIEGIQMNFVTFLFLYLWPHELKF